MKRILFLTSVLITLTHCAPAQEVPNHYKNVHQLIWVVQDLEKTMNGWGKMGFTQVIKLDTLSGYSKKKRNTFNVLCTKANLGGAQVTWLQPLDQNSVFTEFLKLYGDGVMSIIHRFENQEAIDREIVRFSNLKVNLLDDITLSTPKGDINYVMMDTYQSGKYVMGFTSSAADNLFFQQLSNDNQYDLKFSQYAFAIKDETEVSNYWRSLGLPEIQVSTPNLSEEEYYNKKKDFEVDLGWQFHGTIPYEWVIPNKAPMVHLDHIQNHGEGFHHLGFDVKNMESVLDDFSSKNIDVISGGAWGDKGHPGSGIFKYMNTDDCGGVVLELIWRHESN